MNRLKGFTLIELMVTISIAAILLTVGAPSLNSLYQNTRADSGIKQIHQALYFARSHAISLGQNITVCPKNGSQCNNGKNNWKNGMIVFIDSDRNDVPDTPQSILIHVSAFHDKDIVQFNRAISIKFQPDGTTFGAAGTLTYCPDEADNESSKAVIINFAGRIRYSQDAVITCSTN
ncbi:GspH/FimT family pseudopilin [Parashewanella spongiae]|nr:GspH/FimT family pseudopilin [Parashewanella spongiae]MCL1079514.1 GspH/FimT family pseudopilin [Parashewanella spongiae]